MYLTVVVLVGWQRLKHDPLARVIMVSFESCNTLKSSRRRKAMRYVCKDKMIMGVTDMVTWIPNYKTDVKNKRLRGTTRRVVAELIYRASYNELSRQGDSSKRGDTLERPRYQLAWSCPVAGNFIPCLLLINSISFIIKGNVLRTICFAYNLITATRIVYSDVDSWSTRSSWKQPWTNTEQQLGQQLGQELGQQFLNSGKFLE